jgi:dephospho-CoA kinase
MLPRVARIVGLTGGIASGKSTVARMLTELGAIVIDADAIVHELQAPGSPLLAEIIEAFGPQILTADGALDRPALGALVFSDAEARERLGSIVHPKVGAEMLRRIAAARSSGAALIVLDIPLLFEGRARGTGSAAQFALDATILATVPEEAQVERQMERDGCDREEALRRIRAQLPLEEKQRLADYVIDNSGSRAETERQVREVVAALTAAEAP